MSSLIREATADDATAIADIYGPIVRDTFISFESEAPSEDDFRARIAGVTAQYPWLVCEIDGDVVGYAYGSKLRERSAYRWSTEMTVYIAEGHRGDGVGRALSVSVIVCLKVLGFRQAFGELHCRTRPASDLSKASVVARQAWSGRLATRPANG